MHWTWDVIRQIRKQGIVLDAYIIERLHLRAKATADPVENTSTYERSVLRKLVHCHFEDFQFNELGSLVGPCGELPGFPGVILADKATFCGMHMSVGEIIFRGDSVGRVAACVEEEGTILVVVEALDRMDDRNLPNSVRVRRTGRTAVWKITDVQPAEAWYRDGGYEVVLRI